ncbi:MAG: TolC family protein [Epsilonproteobacteria bacterium]|nr:TolC family protein [Campylobacterota bacterium]
MQKLALIVIFSSLLFSQTLNQVIRTALRHSPIIKQRKLEIKEAQLKKKKAVASKYGELDIVGSYTHYNIERTLAPLPPSAMKSPTPPTTTKDIYSIGLNYSVPLFTGFAQTREIEIANLARELSRAKLKITKEELIYNIKSLYTTILSLKELYRAQKNYTKALYSLKRKVALGVKYGKLPEIDLIKIDSEISASKVNEEMFKSNIEVTKATLSSIVGKEVRGVAPIRFRVKRPRYSVKRLYKEILKTQKVRIDEISIEKAKKGIKKAQALKYPQVALNAYGGKNFGKDINTDDWDSETIWQVGVNVKYTLSDFGKRDATIELAKVGKIKASLKKQQTLLELKKSLVKAVSDLKLNYNQYLGNLSSYRLSKKSKEIEEVRYESGVVDINDLLLARAKTQLARAKVIQSKYEYLKSRYLLDYVLERGEK